MTELAPDDPRHGTRRGYDAYHCHCDLCRDASVRYRKWLQKQHNDKTPAEFEREVRERKEETLRVAREMQDQDDRAALDGFKAWLDERRERLNNTVIMIDTPGTVQILHLERD